MSRLLPVLFLALVCGCVDQPAARLPATDGAPTSRGPRIAVKPYLNMPRDAAGHMPARLSETGVFADLQSLTPVAGVLPYDLVLSFWSDGAVKSRLAAIPAGKVQFSVDGEWQFPPGTVMVKTFDLPLDARQPQQRRRLETRLLVIGDAGSVYGVTYKWRADLSDAELLADSASEDITIRDASGQASTQTWYYPGRAECLECHNTHTPGQLGPKTRQMNRDVTYADGTTGNQLLHWNRLGLFAPALDEGDIASMPRLARPDEAGRDVIDRARSYLDANCAHCHRPGGTVANFDARYSTPLAEQKIIDGPVLIDQGVDRARVISPHDPWRSIMLLRVNTNGDMRMPPLARKTIDQQGVAVLSEWIDSMEGRDVLAPPVIAPAGGNFTSPVVVTLSSAAPGAEIRYTVDGSAPGASDPLYSGPITLDGPTVLRARVYKDGYTRSVIAQQVYVISQ